MQLLQQSAYRRTTATVLARLDYASLAQGLGLRHVELNAPDDLEAKVRGILAMPGPVLVSVHADYGKRPIRWIEAVKRRFTQELSTEQKIRFLTRMSRRALTKQQND
jgi:acetolactate synthase-1/2/3 large subunit